MNNNNSLSRLIRWSELSRITGLGRTTIWRREKQGRFPKKVDLGGGLVAWREDQVQEWLTNPADYKEVDTIAQEKYPQQGRRII